jgi:glutathione synthase/RimK-type ligase-like ATP-grasp enzyme
MRRERRPDEFDGYIRNHSNGWIFASNDVVEPADLRPLATAACNSLGMDFGAVDIIWNERDNKCYLLEVNSAPGLEGITLMKYTQAIYNWIRRQI